MKERKDSVFNSPNETVPDKNTALTLATPANNKTTSTPFTPVKTTTATSVKKDPVTGFPVVNNIEQLKPHLNDVPTILPDDNLKTQENLDQVVAIIDHFAIKDFHDSGEMGYKESRRPLPYDTEDTKATVEPPRKKNLPDVNNKEEKKYPPKC